MQEFERFYDPRTDRPNLFAPSLWVGNKAQDAVHNHGELERKARQIEIFCDRDCREDALIHQDEILYYYHYLNTQILSPLMNALTISGKATLSQVPSSYRTEPLRKLLEKILLILESSSIYMMSPQDFDGGRMSDAMDRKFNIDESFGEVRADYAALSEELREAGVTPQTESILGHLAVFNAFEAAMRVRIKLGNLMQNLKSAPAAIRMQMARKYMQLGNRDVINGDPAASE